MQTSYVHAPLRDQLAGPGPLSESERDGQTRKEGDIAILIFVNPIGATQRTVAAAASVEASAPSTQSAFTPIWRTRPPPFVVPLKTG